MKLLMWAALAVLVIYLARRAMRPRVPKAKQNPAIRQEPMTQCAHCGVHFPASEAVPGPSDSLFCSTEHLRLHTHSRQ